MTKQDLIALVELMNRCPMSAAERLWVQEMVRRIQAMIAVPPPGDKE